jgi:N6-L-threonylcarbamoyladenine synthase
LKKNIDYIAVTSGPGLITSLRVGVETAKTLSYAWNKKLVEINHLEGHIYSSLLNNLKIYNFVGKVRADQSFTAIKRIKFPALALIVSGGHTQLVMLRDYLKYKIIGETVDDAAGEAFDKVAKILGLGYPGGPVVSRAAKDGDSGKINFPRPMINSDDYNFSFSGLKTAVLYYVKSQPSLNVKVVNDICANFEQACVEVLVHKTIKAALNYGVKTVLLGGGVAANNQLRQRLEINLKQKMPKCIFLAPEIKWTGDNAAMIALAGYYKIKANKFADWKKVKTEANLRLR